MPRKKHSEEPEEVERLEARAAEETPVAISEIPPGHRSGFIAVLGRPNVGKSTLVNALVGEKIAIVSEKPQTTRTRIMGILTTDQYQMIFLDTPGIHAPKHRLGEIMVEVAKKSVPDADLILFVVDGSEPLTEEDLSIARFLREKAEVPVVLVVNKADLFPPGAEAALVEPIEKECHPVRRLRVSATAGIGLEELKNTIYELLPEGPRFYPEDTVTDQPERVIAAELVREQILTHLRQEVPHAVAVVVQDFKDRPNGMVYISANIYVEKESQKHIVIGREGSMLRKIGEAARRQIEAFLGTKVYLDLWVKLRKDWRKKEPSLREMGYRA